MLKPSFQNIPSSYQEFRDAWDQPDWRQSCLQAYQSGELSFVPNLLPEQALQLSAQETLEILRGRFGEAVELALLPAFTDPDHVPGEMPAAVRSPLANQPDTRWLKRANLAGVNVRTVGSFWNLVKYALTLPAAQDAIHVLPIWEPGVAGSIYGMNNWELNQEFYSPELQAAFPHLNTTSRQLRAVINLLHGMGKAVGMDVIPHTDRFSEIVLAHPDYFEWLQRQDTNIINHPADLHKKVQEKITQFLVTYGPAVPEEPAPFDPADLFQECVGEDQRLRALLGSPGDEDGRQTRRRQLIHHLYRYGYEPVPATMAPPYRGLVVDPNPEAKTVDADGQVWRDYRMAQATPMSRVFGPLTRYKLYEALDDNRNWEIDFSRPRQAVWDYVCEKYAQVQRRYGFDFMRGDMSHIQMRPDGVPAEPGPYYDLLGAVKRTIQQDKGVPWFGYFAETFLAARDVMLYGEEIDHLEAAGADVTLGDLQSTVLGSPDFLQRFRYAIDLARTRLCTPSFTVITADKDDPRFDHFYQGGNEARLFIALLLSELPSYMSLGFETREIHYEPASNEHYTKLYVFHFTSGPKATNGPYEWGKNGYLFGNVTRMRLYLDTIWPKIKGCASRWLIPPDATGANPVIAWAQPGDDPEFVFVVNTDPERPAAQFALPHLDHNLPLLCDFSTQAEVPEADRRLVFNGKHYKLTRMDPGEARLYRVEAATWGK